MAGGEGEDGDEGDDVGMVGGGARRRVGDDEDGVEEGDDVGGGWQRRRRRSAWWPMSVMEGPFLRAGLSARSLWIPRAHKQAGAKALSWEPVHV